MEHMLHSGMHRGMEYLHHVITNKKYMIWYMSITLWIITLNLIQVPPPGYMQYEQHAHRIGWPCCKGQGH
jgi:hypothetical protein